MLIYILNNVLAWLILIDVDECSDSSGSGSGSGSGSMHMCSQHCNNTVGSHFCDCYVGYKLQDDGITCTGELFQYREDAQWFSFL